jgi:hypothetical protein
VPPPPAIVPGTVAPPPAIVPGTVASPPVLPGHVPAPARPGASTYQGGNYSELETEPITGMGVPGSRGGVRQPAVERSGSLTGHLLSREMSDRRAKRRRLRTTLSVVTLLVLFGAFIATVVVVLAGDFIRGLFHTLSQWAG